MKIKLKKIVTLFLFILSAFVINAVTQVNAISIQLDDYYNGYESALNSKTGIELRRVLTELITDTHTHITSYTDCKNPSIVEQTDGDPDNPGNIILFWSGLSVPSTWDSGTTWNREHVWPKSNAWYVESDGGADLHHIRPTDPRVNTVHSNYPYGVVSGGNYVATSTTNGSIETTCKQSGGVFEPCDEKKGDAARIIFYMMTRYSESDLDFLSVTNDGKEGENNYPITKVATAGTTEKETMAMLLEWNNNDPVDQSEINRNNAVEAIQGNRNPFIDNSNFANLIWDSENSTVQKGKINITYDNTKTSVVVNGTKDSSGYYTGAVEIVVTPVNLNTYTGIKDDDLNKILTTSTIYVIPNVTRDYNLTITSSDDSNESIDSGESNESENLGNGETVSVDLANGRYISSEIAWTTTDGNVTITQNKGTNTSTGVSSSYISAPRVYKGHILSFIANDGYKIASISLSYTGSYYGNSMTAGTTLNGTSVIDNETDVLRTWSTASGGTHIVSSADTNGLSKIYIQNVSTENKQFRPTSINITYASNNQSESDEEETYTVVFDSNGGSSVDSIENISSGAKITAPSEPTRDGYTFDGWYYNDDVWNFDTDTVTQNMTLTAEWVISDLGSSEQVKILSYSTGFESSEGFASGTYYQTTTTTGQTGYEWSTYYGTPSTTDAISGNQSMQMRWYTSKVSNIGYTMMNFDVSNVSYVTFKAKNSNKLNVKVSYSVDGGSSWVGSSTYTLSTITTEYKYVVSEIGEYSNVRIRFDMVLPSINPTSTSKLYIDDVSIYSIEQKEYYTVKFDSNGGSSVSDKTNILSGSTIAEPSKPTRDGYTFDGWYYNDDVWNFDTDTVTQNMTLTAHWISNAFLSSIDKLNSVQAYMSLAYKYKYSDVSSVQITDTLTNSLIGTINGNSYSSWNNITSESSAVYAGQTCNNSSGYIQIKSKDSTSGIVTTSSNGLAKQITVVWDTKTTSGRTLQIYGSNSPYTSPQDLYSSSTCGELISSISYDGYNTTCVLDITTNYTYIGMKSSSGAMYFDSINIVWEESESGIEYSDVDFRLKVGVDEAIENVASDLDGAVCGIEVSYNGQYIRYTNSKYVKQDGIAYYIISLGDVLNNPERIDAIFTVKAYMEYEGKIYYSTNEKNYSVKTLVDKYLSIQLSNQELINALDSLKDVLEKLGYTFES